jgi:hypothetical protein
MGTPVTSSPSSVVNQGSGIVWQSPSAATATGIGSNQPALITGFSISGNVVSFTTATQAVPLVAGQVVTVSMVNTSYLDTTLTVLSSGLGSTSFSANFTHADVSTTFDSGIATPTTTFAYAQNQEGDSPPGGTYVVYSTPTTTTPEAGAGGCFGMSFLPYYIYSNVSVGVGVNGCPFGATTQTSSSGFCPIPTLPVGAVVTGMYPVAMGTHVGGFEAAFECSAGGSPGAYSFPLDGTFQKCPNSLGTDLSILSSTYFTLTMASTLETSTPYTWTASVPFYGVAVEYTISGGSPIPSTQVQTLAATNFTGFGSISSNDLITGVQVNLASGMEFGSDATLSVQITLNGTPVGTAMTQTVGSWSTPYPFGEDGALWGISSNPLPGSDAAIIGVNANVTLPNGSQINLNDWTMTLYVTTPLTLFLLANAVTIEQGASSNLLWVVGGYTDASIDEGIGSVPLSGNMEVSPLVTTTYTLTGTGSGIPTGTATATVTVLSNEAAFALQKLILTLKEDSIPVRGRNSGGGS